MRFFCNFARFCIIVDYNIDYDRVYQGKFGGFDSYLCGA